MPHTLHTTPLVPTSRGWWHCCSLSPPRCSTRSTRGVFSLLSFSHVVFIAFVYDACYAHSGNMCMASATCASLSCVYCCYSGRPRRSSSEMQDRRLAQTWGLLRRNSAILEHSCCFQRGGWFCLRFPHVGRRGWIHEAFQRVRSNRCVIPAAHQVRRTHRDATHITHHSVRSPPAGGGIFSLPPPRCSTRTTRARCFSSSSYITRATRTLVVCV